MMASHEPGIALPGNRWDLLDGQSPQDLPTVSVIVPHYCQQRQLDRTMHALMTQDYPADHVEIIVVDDGSPQPPDVPAAAKLLIQDNRGFRVAAARNRGASAARNEILCFLDADTTPESTYLRKLTRLPALAPDCVTVGRRRHAALSSTEIQSPVGVEGPLHELPDPAWLRAGYKASRNLLDADDRSYRFMIGAVIACTRNFFTFVGGFDESFTEYGGEDWEWAYRAWLAGAVFAHVPDAIAWHDGPEWAGRTVQDRQTAKNAETLRLTGMIPIPGSRGHSIRSGYVDVLVEPSATDWSPAARFMCLDSVLADVPEAHILNRDEGGNPRDHPHLDRVRFRIKIHRPVRVTGGALRAAINKVSAEQLGRLIIVSDSGNPLATVISTRAASRQKRWNNELLFPNIIEKNTQFVPVDNEPDLEGYLADYC